MGRPPSSLRGRRKLVMERAWRAIAAPFLLGMLGMSSGMPSQLASGIWGGEQVTLTVGPDMAVLKLGCAQGELAAPIRLDTRGRFSSPGVFRAETGGPDTGVKQPEKARYAGTLSDGRLTLTVSHGGSTETYRLAHGIQSKVIRCL